MEVAAPAFDEPVFSQPAIVVITGADGGELSGGRNGLSNLLPSKSFVGTPALDRAVLPQPAGVSPTCADGGELPGRGRGLTRPITTPTG